MAKLFSDRQLKVKAQVIDYLLPRMVRDYAGMAALVDNIDRQALAKSARLPCQWLQKSWKVISEI